MPVTPEAVAHLARHGHEAVHAAAVGLATVSDAEVLAVARREARVVITADLDYPRCLALESAQGPGIILFRGGSYSDSETGRIVAKGTSDLVRKAYLGM